MSLPPHERYQSKPFFGSSHSWTEEYCGSIPSTTAVLDIGSGSGVLGKALRTRGFTDLSAVEIDSTAREATREIYNTIHESVHSYSGKTFSLILLLDVLEHTTNPPQFLAEVIPLLAPGGTMILSVPNVAHWSVRLPLLFGHFAYTERGILDKTHFHLFTRRTLTQLIGKFPELTLQTQAASIPPTEFVLPRVVWDNPVYRFLSRIHFAVAQILPGFFGYQVLAVVKRRS